MPQMFPSPILILMIVVSMICLVAMTRLFWNANLISIKKNNMSEASSKNKSKEFSSTW